MPSYTFVIESAGERRVETRELQDNAAARDVARKTGKRTFVTIHSEKMVVDTIRNP